MTNRRVFLKGLLGISAAASSEGRLAPYAGGWSTETTAGRDYFEELGIEPFINALAPYSSLGGSQVWPEVIEAMTYAMKHRARMKDLHDAVGKRIASLIGCEAAMVPAGATSAITLGTAACLTGANEELIHRLPDVTGMKDQVISQKGHRYSYDHAVRNCGVRFMEVETVADLERAIGDRTAMMFFVLNRESQGKIGAEEYAAIGKHHGVPTLIDGATLIPPAENLVKIARMGFDLACFSGGKGLRGPYSAGLLLGRHSWLWR
jgi:seryl-tRNA(Sec) selenium transferase